MFPQAENFRISDIFDIPPYYRYNLPNGRKPRERSRDQFLPSRRRRQSRDNETVPRRLRKRLLRNISSCVLFNKHGTETGSQVVLASARGDPSSRNRAPERERVYETRYWHLQESFGPAEIVIWDTARSRIVVIVVDPEFPSMTASSVYLGSPWSANTINEFGAHDENTVIDGSRNRGSRNGHLWFSISDPSAVLLPLPAPNPKRVRPFRCFHHRGGFPRGISLSFLPLRARWTRAVN